jgi:undecaprenyl-diphosphatase
VASAVVGYAVIAWFLRYLAKHPLDVFAYYRLGLSGAVLVWLLGT